MQTATELENPTASARLDADNTYARLPERFFARVKPTPVRQPHLFYANEALAQALRIDVQALGAGVWAGNMVPPGADPIALAYAGHQFGSFVQRLGDGRAILLGEVLDGAGRRWDVQLKGAGPTPFSRGGDGRAALGPVMREVLVGEAMAALGIPSTRSLAAVTTGEQVQREEPLPGAVLARVAASHLRVGTFEYFAARRDVEGLSTLTAYALARHYPDAGQGALALLDRVICAQAELVARWLGVGFVHGVMNTDNTSISGETIDYGPCAFLDEYDPGKTFSSIDRQGRYAFANQPRIAGWNLARLAEALLPLVAEEQGEAVHLATQALQQFVPRFEAAHARVFGRKLGLAGQEAGDGALSEDLLALLASDGVDYTVFFRKLGAAAEDASGDEALAAGFRDAAAMRTWLATWRQRLAREGGGPTACATVMRGANPAFIPRNHRVEEAIDAAVHRADFAPFRTLLRVLSRPYDDQPEHAALATPPLPEERVTRTFCGT